MSEIMQLDDTYIAHTYARFPVRLVEGEGSILWDESGRRYIDLGSGIAVNTFGIADKEWQKAVTAQLGRLQHTSNLYYTGPCAHLAEMLCQRTGMKKVFFSNSGAEANECAIKAARKYAAAELGAEYSTIVTLQGSFHGRTLATLAATGQDVFHRDYQPLPKGFVYAKPGDLDQLAALLKNHRCAAVMMEVVQGEGGVNVLDKEYLQKAAALAADHGALVIVDEVQTGNGRTGRLYGYMHYGIQPDIITTAKGLGGGLPLGATLLGEKVADVFVPGDHGSTFGGNPVCCAGAISILNRLDEQMLSRVRAKGNLVRGALEGAPGVESVTGMGLMLGVKTTRPAAKVAAECLRAGVLVLTAKDKVRLLPALNIPDQQLQDGVEILKQVCARVD
ncbi:MAG TPA: acetylornithine/succinylornithine family transaminase [Candidatus Anaerofilum excrementigallinarum]|nr:acetylornithine/succinylornithine family transaminase [Candidatus Anaerofilum excrementigallinarum]